MIDLLYYSFLFAALLIFSGIGLCLLFCPQSLRPYILPLSPVMGYCYVTLAGWYCFIFDLGGTDSSAVYVVLPPLIFLYLGIRKYKRQGLSLVNVGEWGIPLCIGLLAFVVLSIPLIDDVQGLTTIALSNSDIADSATKATILKEFTTSESPGFIGQRDTLRYHLTLSYFGPNLVVAFSSSLLSLKTYQLESLSVHVFFLFGVLLFYAVARESLRYNRLAALGLSALYGFNPLMWYVVYQGYLAQIIATTISLGFFLIHFKIIDHCKSRSDYFAYIPFVVLLNWGIFISYPQVFPLIYAIVVLYLIFTCFQDRSIKGISSWSNFFLKAFCLSLILSPHRVAGIVLSVLVVTAANFGWFFPVIPPTTFLGILDMISAKGVIWFHDFSGSHGTSLFLGLALLLVLIVSGLYQARKTDRKVFLLAGAAQLFVFSAYMVLIFRDSSELGLGGYRSFKLLTFFLPLILLTGFIIFRQTQWRNFFLVLAGVVLVACNVRAAYNLTGHMVKHYRSVTPDLVSLKKIEDNPAIESINILGSDWWEILWQTNFLLRKRLYFQTGTYQGRERSALLGEWDLSKKRPDIVHLYGFEKPETIDVNPTYRLKKTWVPDRFGVKFVKGWQTREETRIRMDSSQATIFLYSPDDHVIVDLQASFESADPARRLFINLRGSHIIECSLVCRMNEILLTKGRNTIEFQTERLPGDSGSDDPHPSGLALTSLDIHLSTPSRD